MNKYIITDEVLISFDNIISLKFIKRNMRF